MFPDLPGRDPEFVTDKEFLHFENVGSSDLEVSGTAGWDGDESSTESVRNTAVQFPVYEPVLE